MNIFTVPAPTFVLIRIRPWPDFLIPRHYSDAEAAHLSPRMQKARKETSEYRHGTTKFSLMVKGLTWAKPLPCVLVPHITEVGA